jgi:hypothetical protein
LSWFGETQPLQEPLRIVPSVRGSVVVEVNIRVARAPVRILGRIQAPRDRWLAAVASDTDTLGPTVELAIRREALIGLTRAR